MIDLDEATAHFALKQPLQFGNPLQIAAVELLSSIDSLAKRARDEKWRLCPACHGDGMVLGWCACAICEEIGIVDADSEPVTHLVDKDSPVCRALIERLRDARQGVEWRV